jgi:uncharacterized protein (DUF2267 family)
MNAKLQTMTTQVLVDLCCKLARDDRSEATTVTDAALSVLESRLSSEQFVAFCDELCKAMA